MQIDVCPRPHDQQWDFVHIFRVDVQLKKNIGRDLLHCFPAALYYILQAENASLSYPRSAIFSKLPFRITCGCYKMAKDAAFRIIDTHHFLRPQNGCCIAQLLSPISYLESPNMLAI